MDLTGGDSLTAASARAPGDQFEAAPEAYDPFARWIHYTPGNVEVRPTASAATEGITPRFTSSSDDDPELEEMGTSGDLEHSSGYTSNSGIQSMAHSYRSYGDRPSSSRDAGVFNYDQVARVSTTGRKTVRFATPISTFESPESELPGAHREPSEDPYAPSVDNEARIDYLERTVEEMSGTIDELKRELAMVKEQIQVLRGRR